MLNSLVIKTKVLTHLIPELKSLVHDLSFCFVLVPLYVHLNYKCTFPSPIVRVNITH